MYKGSAVTLSQIFWSMVYVYQVFCTLISLTLTQTCSDFTVNLSVNNGYTVTLTSISYGQNHSRPLFLKYFSRTYGIFLLGSTCLILHPYNVGMIKRMIRSKNKFLYKSAKVTNFFFHHEFMTFIELGPFKMVSVPMV